jgi:hypothetical protein
MLVFKRRTLGFFSCFFRDRLTPPLSLLGRADGVIE